MSHRDSNGDVFFVSCGVVLGLQCEDEESFRVWCGLFILWEEASADEIYTCSCIEETCGNVYGLGVSTVGKTKFVRWWEHMAMFEVSVVNGPPMKWIGHFLPDIFSICLRRVTELTVSIFQYDQLCTFFVNPWQSCSGKAFELSLFWQANSQRNWKLWFFLFCRNGVTETALFLELTLITVRQRDVSSIPYVK